MAIRGVNAAEDLLRAYVAGIVGILVDHVSTAEELGGVLRQGSHGRAYVVIGRKAWPVLCGDFAEYVDEDGPQVGRCGAIATLDYQCAHHGAARAEWLGMSERERAAQERAEDERAEMGRY